MNQLYLVPDIHDLEYSVQLAGEYGCAYEYNDFLLRQYWMIRKDRMK